MRYSFIAYGHKNIVASHKTTLEFTKDNVLSLRGNCIVGVKSNFDLGAINEFIKNKGNGADNRIKILIKPERSSLQKIFFQKTNGKKFYEEFFALLNPLFSHPTELVIRKSGFVDERTFAIMADKSAADLNRDFVELLKNPMQKIIVKLI